MVNDMLKGLAEGARDDHQHPGIVLHGATDLGTSVITPCLKLVI